MSYNFTGTFPSQSFNLSSSQVEVPTQLMLESYSRQTDCPIPSHLIQPDLVDNHSAEDELNLLDATIDPRLQQMSPSANSPCDLGHDGSPTPSNPAPLHPIFGINGAFVDEISRVFALSHSSSDLHNNLHDFNKLCSQLPKDDTRARVYVLAAMLSVLQLQRTISIQWDKLNHVVDDLSIRLNEKFDLTKEQNMNIRLVANDIISEPFRVSFILFWNDVYRILKAKQTDFRLNNIFGNPMREQILIRILKRTCVSVQNGLREMYRDSVIHPSATPLSEFVYCYNNRFKLLGATGSTSNAQVGSIALARRFAYENLHLLNVEEVDDDDTVEDQDGTRTSNGKRKRAAATDEPTPKRSRGGRLRKGSCFWSQYEAHLQECIAKFGASFESTGWKSYIADTIKRDETKFPPEGQFPPTNASIQLPKPVPVRVQSTSNSLEGRLQSLDFTHF